MPAINHTTVEELPLNRGVSVLAHNADGLVALDKPAGALSHPNKSGEEGRSILNAAYNYEEEYYYWKNEAGEERRAWLLNRLDSPTSGVILFGLNSELSSIVKHEFATHKVTKIYYALVKGTFKVQSGVWLDKLSKEVKTTKPSMKKRSQSVSAKARYLAMKTPISGLSVTLLKLMPTTGRTHQLRIQCKKHGHPIVGDQTYGSFSFNREVISLTQQKRLMLHSGETAVNYKYNGKLRQFKASSELPEEYQTVLSYRAGADKYRPKPNLAKRPVPSKRSALINRRFKS